MRWLILFVFCMAESGCSTSEVRELCANICSMPDACVNLSESDTVELKLSMEKVLDYPNMYGHELCEEVCVQSFTEAGVGYQNFVGKCGDPATAFLVLECLYEKARNQCLSLSQVTLDCECADEITESNNNCSPSSTLVGFRLYNEHCIYGESCAAPGKNQTEDRCGQWDDNWPCNCDSTCEQKGDCCSDYVSYCEE